MLARCRKKTVPHRYQCETSVTNTRNATRGKLLMQDNLDKTFLAHDYIPSENNVQIVDSQENFQC